MVDHGYARHPYEYRKRWPAVVIALLLLSLAGWRSMLPLQGTLAVVAFGVIAGSWCGHLLWKRLVGRVASDNTVITYFTEGWAYAFIVLLFLLSLAPRLLFQLNGLGIQHPASAYAVLLFGMALAVGYNVQLFRAIRHYELTAGPLKPKKYYAGSVTGAEALIGARGRVIDECNPRGRVLIGPERWNARSLGGGIAAGEQVVVRYLEGLALVVEADSGPDLESG